MISLFFYILVLFLDLAKGCDVISYMMVTHVTVIQLCNLVEYHGNYKNLVIALK